MQMRPGNPTITGLRAAIMVIASVSIGMAALAVEPREVLVRVADQVLRDLPDPPGLHEPPEYHWRGVNWGENMLMEGLLHAYSVTGDTKYREYVRRWIHHWSPEEIDTVLRMRSYCGHWNAGSVFWLFYELTGDAYARTLAELVTDFVMHEGARNEDGTFSHRDGPYDIWVDTAYMVVPLLLHAGDFRGDATYTDEAIRQAAQHEYHLYDPHSSLYIHRVDLGLRMRSTGLWARGNGWMAMSLVEAALGLPPGHEQRVAFEQRLREMLPLLVDFQDDETGLWFTVLDDDSLYVEISAAAMFLYTMDLARAHGIVDDAFVPAANRAWEGLMAHVTPEGRVTGVSAGTNPAADYTAIEVGSFPWGTGMMLKTAAHRARLDETPEMLEWHDRWQRREPPVRASGIQKGSVGELPTVTVTPPSQGRHLVRFSAPFAPAAFPADMGIEVHDGIRSITPDVRVLTRHPGQPASVRRAMITFPYDFAAAEPQVFTLALSATAAAHDPPERAPNVHGAFVVEHGDTRVHLRRDRIRVDDGRGGVWHAQLIGPPQRNPGRVQAEVIEWGAHYGWIRLLSPDPEFPRIIEVRIDSTGTVTAQAHFQRTIRGDDTAPDLGWRIAGPPMATTAHHHFEAGTPFVAHTADGATQVSFPVAPAKHRGQVWVETSDDRSEVRYLRAQASDELPFQNATWRRAEFVIGASGHTPLNLLLESSVAANFDWRDYDAIYGSGAPLDVGMHGPLDRLVDFAWEHVKGMQRRGDDFGNLTQIHSGVEAAVVGSNRLPQAPPLFLAAYRRADPALRDIALAWCNNFHDLTLWWGRPTDVDGWRQERAVFGGTRYAWHEDRSKSNSFQWRGEPSYDFCTKGYDAFFFAYEETGDPRMAHALHWQLEYAREEIRCNAGPGFTRQITNAMDHLRLYRYTGVEEQLDEALRLFHELRSVLSEDYLFDQHAGPVEHDLPFIENDAQGLLLNYAKPYIIGTALLGLPMLWEHRPDEPALLETIEAAANFLAEVQDPLGGWRYPHWNSSSLSLHNAAEFAAQLARGASVLDANGRSIDHLLDAIETILQTLVAAHNQTGTLISALHGWEYATGLVSDADEMRALYERAGDRDPSRDYTEGRVGIGSAVPEGLVYIEEALAFYLEHRPPERLLNVQEPLRTVLGRVEDRRAALTPAPDGRSITVTPRLAAVDPFQVAMPDPIRVGGTDFAVTDLTWESADNGRIRHGTATRGGITVTLRVESQTDHVVIACTAWPSGGSDATAETLAWTYTLAPVATGESTHDETADEAQSAPEEPTTKPSAPAALALDRGFVAPGTSANTNATAQRIDTEGTGTVTHAVTAQVPKHQPVTARIVLAFAADEPGALSVLHREQDRGGNPTDAVHRFETYGTANRMPAFYDVRAPSMPFPMAWQNAGLPFDEWRDRARALQHQHFSTPPARVPFAPAVIATEDRGTHEARKLSLSINEYNRVGAYLLVPKGEGPFPAVIALHDHGAHFSIGKEKVVRPFGVEDAVLEDATEWITQYYGGRWIGDALAEQGYVVFAMDVTYWGDRGRMEGVNFEDQQALAANMLQMGYSWAGYNAWDDIRSAEFVQSLPEVDPARIGCIGLSMGAYRAWQLSAATDIVKAGVVVCWMGDLEGFMVPDQNQTRGFSAFSMVHPGLSRYLDYPDVASIACPKPMMYQAGVQDTLFPMESVHRSFDKIRGVYADNNADGKLVTRIYDVGHLFNLEMQADAFAWLQQHLQDGGEPSTEDAATAEGGETELGR